MKTTAVFVPVKGSSERIPTKNLQLLDGKPLFLHTLEKLLLIESIDVFLDTESEKVIKLASYLDNLNILRRDPVLASNSTDGNKLFLNEVMSCNHNIVCQHLCTSPFIDAETVLKAISIIGSPSPSGLCYDSSLLVREDKLYTWKGGKPTYDIENIPNSKDLPSTVIETMGLYAVTRNAAVSSRRRIGNVPALLPATPLEATDVNWPEDFEFAQLIAAGKREKQRQLLQNLALILSSALLSDLLDDLGYKNQVIKGLGCCSVDSSQVLGPAKTIKLRAMVENDNFRDIYHALGHYETLVPGDIICVENELPEYAYFGELNANMAIRQGVKGVVVGGMTRDVSNVRRTGLPVFSSGSTCQDVRGRAVLCSMNQVISIKGVLISPGDMIFADTEGIVVIPRLIVEKVFRLIRERFRNERGIVSDIAAGATVSELLENRGDF
jgi:regulator of RNase E activity RraA